MFHRILIGLTFFFFVFSAGIASASTDSTTIKLNFVIEAPSEPMKCDVGFMSDNVDLFHQDNDGCKFDSKKLENKANELVSREIKRIDGMQFVAVTITAP